MKTTTTFWSRFTTSILKIEKKRWFKLWFLIPVQIFGILGIIYTIWDLKQNISQSSTLNEISVKIEKQANAINEQAQAINEQAQSINDQAQSLTTQNISDFPGNIPEIVKLINNAESEISIVTDVPYYGCYSNPIESQKYLDAIIHKIDSRVNVKIVVYNDSLRANAREKQFESKKFQDWSKSEKFKNFCHDSHTKIESYNDFSIEIEKRHTHFIQQACRRQNYIHIMTDKTPIFLWVRDKKEAVFSFPDDWKEEKVFRTFDKDLVEILSRKAQEYFDSGVVDQTTCSGF